MKSKFINSLLFVTDWTFSSSISATIILYYAYIKSNLLIVIHAHEYIEQYIQSRTILAPTEPLGEKSHV